MKRTSKKNVLAAPRFVVDSSPAAAKKNAGRVYTPPRLVRQILDLAGYFGDAVVRRRVLENGCGDGAFLSEIVERYCAASGFESGRVSRSALKSELETFLFGVEIDPVEREKSVRRLDEVAARRGLFGVRWNVLCADATTIADQFAGKFDFVLGNPPYVRVHRLGSAFENVKKFEFARSGMTDLFLVFYEIGLNALKPGGTLGYITPSSFFNSVAGEFFRKKIVDENLLAKLVDLKHFQAFDAATYSAIVVLSKRSAETSEQTSGVDYFEYDATAQEAVFVDRLRPDDFYIDGKFYFSSRRRLNALKAIFKNGAETRFSVKNGFATLADSFFIGDDKGRFGDEFSIPIVKASTGRETRCVFPYSAADGTLFSPEKIAQNVELNRYFNENASALRRRSLVDEGAWRGFGRTQGIADVRRPKIAVSPLIRDANDLKLTPAPPGTGVYGGLYVVDERGEKRAKTVGDASFSTFFADLQRALKSENFAEYVATLGKYKSGGYCAFSSKELKKYLEFQFDAAGR